MHVMSDEGRHHAARIAYVRSCEVPGFRNVRLREFQVIDFRSQWERTGREAAECFVACLTPLLSGPFVLDVHSSRRAGICTRNGRARVIGEHELCIRPRCIQLAVEAAHWRSHAA
ncbi:hypothetical protein VTO73DRAFT_14845 [Trametes versicolor]